MATPDVWLRGPLPDIADIFQPVGHALTQVREDIPPALESLAPDDLWARPGGSAAIGYHAIHIGGATDRLFAYARPAALTQAQREILELEKTAHDRRPGVDAIHEVLTTSLDRALEELTRLDPEQALAARAVGGAKLPSTVLGLLFHAAEHATRHAGQITTLARVLG